MLKADVAGSVEALEDEIAKLPQDEVQVNMHPHRRRRHQRVRRHAGRRLRGVIIGFNVRPVGDARARWPSARASRSAPTRSSTRRSTTCAPRCRACSSPRRSRRPSARSRSARLPRLARSARSPAPTSPTATSRAARRSASSATAPSSTTRRSQPAPLQRRRPRGRGRLRVRHRARRTSRTSRKATSSRSTRRAGRARAPAVVARSRGGSRMAGRRSAHASRGRGRARSAQRRRDPGSQGPAGRLRDRDRVKTSPDLRHARVYVSVLGTTTSRRRRLDGPAVRARLPAGAGRPRAAHEAHAGSWSSSSTTPPRTRRRARAAASRTSRRPGRVDRNGATDGTRAGARRDPRRASASCLVTHEHPDGDALGSLVAMHGVLAALGKDSVMFMAADEFPLPYEYRFFDLDGLVDEPPADLDERTVVFLDCGNIDRNPLESSSATTRTSSTSTTTTTTRASGRSTTSSRTRRARPRSSGT